jgi:threonine dehydrogenase-like Zn-dependent dehydrogenase
MGNLLLQCSKNYGAATIIVSEPVAMRREKALENGATHVIDPTTQDVNKELRKICRIGADLVIEAAGSPKLQEASINYARRGGSILWFGCAPQDKQASVNGFYVNDAELKIIGSYNNLFSTQIAIDLIASGKVQVDNLVSHHFALKDYLDVFKVWGGKDTHKLMVNMD